MVSREYFYLALALPLLALAACSSLNEPAGITYAKSVTQLGITPVYPPREDLQVGDIYAVEEHTYAQRLTAKTAFIAANDLTKQIRAYLNSRYKFNETASSAQPQTDAIGNNNLIAGQQLLTTLPIDGLPEIEVDSGISIGVSGQPQGLSVAFGLAAAKTLKMSLKFQQVTSYEVPLPVGVDELDEYCRTKDPAVCQNQYLVSWLNQKYQLGPSDKGYVKRAGALLVTKVYLARQITYTFNDAVLAAAAVSSVQNGATAPAAPQISNDQINAVLDTKDPAVITAMGSLVTAVSESAKANGAGAGASFQIAAVNKNSVVLTETFQRPVVIGYEGVSVKGQ